MSRRQSLRRPGVYLAKDIDAENCAVGLAMILNFRESAKMLGMLQGCMFWDDMNGWMWNEMRQVVLNQRRSLCFQGTASKWLKDSKIIRRCASRFGRDALRFAFGLPGYSDRRQCWFNGFWWHWPWYIQRIHNAYKLRCEYQRAIAAMSQSKSKMRHFGRFKDW